MNPKNLVRLAAATGIAAVCIGVVAPPAVAHPPGSGTDESTTSQVPAPSLQDVQAFIDRIIANRLATLSDVATRVAADPQLSATRKTDITTALENEQAALAVLKAKVDSASSIDEVWADVRAALSTAQPFWWQWWWFAPRIHHSVRPDQAQHARLAAARAKAREARNAREAREAAARHTRAAEPAVARTPNPSAAPRFRPNTSVWTRGGFDPRFRFHWRGYRGFGNHHHR